MPLDLSIFVLWPINSFLHIGLTHFLLIIKEVNVYLLLLNWQFFFLDNTQCLDNTQFFFFLDNTQCKNVMIFSYIESGSKVDITFWKGIWQYTATVTNVLILFDLVIPFIEIWPQKIINFCEY